MQWKEFKPDDTVWQEGHSTDVFYFILEGAIEVFVKGADGELKISKTHFAREICGVEKNESRKE